MSYDAYTRRISNPVILMFDQQTNCLLLTPFPVSFFFLNKKIGTASLSPGLKNLALYSPHKSHHNAQLAATF